MKAIILAGGKGSRLQPMTNTLPKPIIPLLNRPTIEYSIKLLKKYNITDIFITVHYLSELIQRLLGDGSDYSVNIRYFYEKYPLGTAGCIYKIKDLIGNEPFIIFPGDALSEIDLDQFISEHLKKDSIVSMALRKKTIPTEYGTVVLEEDNKIKGFLEKPTWDEVKSQYVNTGIYMINPEIFDYFPKNQDSVDWSYDIFPKLLSLKKRIHGFPFSGYWEDIGNISTYREANKYLLNELQEGKLKPEGIVEIKDGIYSGTGATISNSSVLIPPVYIGNNVTIESNVKIMPNTIIGDGSLIRKNCKIDSTIIHQNSHIDRDTIINSDSIICSNVKILSESTINNGSVIGAYSMIGKNVVINNNIHISNNQIISDNSYINEHIVRNIRDNSIEFINYYNIKGSTNLEITAETVLRLSLAITTILPKQSKVIIARDNSNAARMFKRSFIAGIVSASNQVIDMEEGTIPLLRNTSRQFPDSVSVFLGCENNNFLTLINIYGKAGRLMEKAKYRGIENNFLLRNFKYASPEQIGSIAYRGHSVDSYLNLFKTLELGKKTRIKKKRIIVGIQKGKVSEFLLGLLTDRRLEYDFIIELFGDESSIQDICAEYTTKISNNNADLGVFFHKHGERIYFFDNKGDLINDYEFNKILILLYEKNKLEGKVNIPIYYSDYFSEINKEIKIEKIKDRELYDLGKLDKNLLHQVTPNSLYIVPKHSQFPDAIVTFFYFLQLMDVEEEISLSSMKKIQDIHMLYQSFLIEENKKLFILQEIENFLKDDAQKAFFDRDYGVKISYGKRDWIFVKLDKNKSSIHLWIEAQTKTLLQERFKKFQAFLKKIQVLN